MKHGILLTEKVDMLTCKLITYKCLMVIHYLIVYDLIFIQYVSVF